MNDLFTDQGEQPQIDPNKNYLEELVGDGKKFKSPEELAKGKFFADQMVDTQNKRFDELRQEYLRVMEENKAKAKLEDMIQKIADQRLASSENTQAKEDDTPKLDMNQIDKLFEEKLNKVESIRKQEQNFNLVQSKLKERYGENFANVLKQETEKLGLQKDYVNDMARNQPTALLRLIGADRAPSADLFNAPPQSNQRGDTFAPSAPKERTWSYYQDLKKKDPKIYFDRNTAIQMQQDAIRLGDKFNDGDFWKKGLHEQ